MLNEIIFFLGIGITVCSFVGAIVYFALSQVKLRQLKEQLDKEYGKEVFEELKKDKKKAGK